MAESAPAGSAASAESAVGSEFEVEVGDAAAGGSCVARAQGRVVFVRHALPGERVLARVTEDNGRYLRADAVAVLRSSADRVLAPCPHAAPGRCGGCDWQHASGPAQLELKAAVVAEQFRRLGGIDLVAELGAPVPVEALPGGLLGWRTRIAFAADASGRLGLRRHGSHEIELLEACPLGVPGVGDSPVLRERRPGCSGVEVVAGEDAIAVVEHRPGPGRQARGRRPPDRLSVVEGPDRLSHRVDGRAFTVAATGFWQVHPAAASTLASAVLTAVAPAAGESVLELFAGAGALTAALATAVGPHGRVVAVESAGRAVADAQANLADLPQVQVRTGRVGADTIAALIAEAAKVDVVVLDPPRAGAGREVMAALAACGARAIGYVSCDPASLARDVRAALDAGLRLTALRVFDAFPMTAHVECLALLTGTGGTAG